MHKTRQKYMKISEGKEMLIDVKEQREDTLIITNNTNS